MSGQGGGGQQGNWQPPKYGSRHNAALAAALAIDHGGGGGGGGGAGGLSQLPGVPAGTCIPSQLHGVMVRHAIRAHCCSGVNGPGPAHGGVPGVPQIGSADAIGKPAKLPMAVSNARTATNPLIKRRRYPITNSNLFTDAQSVTPAHQARQPFDLRRNVAASATPRTLRFRGKDVAASTASRSAAVPVMTPRPQAQRPGITVATDARVAVTLRARQPAMSVRSRINPRAARRHQLCVPSRSGRR